MESSILRRFLPDLVTAVSDCVHSVSDRCLAEGLIPESIYRRVLESGGTSEDKTRSLLLAVIKSTETDSRCLGILLNILEQVLPYGVRDKLLSVIKKELTEQAECTSVVAMGHNSQSVTTQPGIPLISEEIVKYQAFLFGKLEDSIRQYEHACAEKKLLEERMKSKEEENEGLKTELERLKLSQIADSAKSSNAMVVSMEGQISAVKAEMSELRERIEELESIIEEQGMQVKRSRNAMGLDITNLMRHLGFLAEKKISQVKQDSEEKETELLAALREKEAMLREKEVQHVKEKEQAVQKMQEEKETELLAALREKEVMLREKEEQHVKEKEQAVQKMQEELMVAQEDGREREQRSSQALKEKDVELQLERREKERAEEELKQLQHRIALLERDLKIKDLELNREQKLSKPKKHQRNAESNNTEEPSKVGFFDRFRRRTNTIKVTGPTNVQATAEVSTAVEPTSSTLLRLPSEQSLSSNCWDNDRPFFNDNWNSM